MERFAQLGISQYDELGIDQVSLSGQQVVTPLFHRTQGENTNQNRLLDWVEQPLVYLLRVCLRRHHSSMLHRSHCQCGELEASKNYVRL